MRFIETFLKHKVTENYVNAVICNRQKTRKNVPVDNCVEMWISP